MTNRIRAALFAVSVFPICVACTGPAGPQGTAGADGSNGADGTDGTNGDDGAPGADGNDGANGSDGSNGIDGVNGDDGLAGVDGDDGAPGQIISNEAALGLSISPAPVDVAGLDNAAVERIGRGSYIVNAVADCAGCHGNPADPTQFLGGGAQFGPFPDGGGGFITVFTRNLTSDPTTGLSVTNETDFIELIRTGRDFKDATGGSSLLVMPWPTYRWMSDEDLGSVFAYLQAIPAVSNAVPADTKPPIPPLPFTGDYNEGEVDRPLPSSAFDDGFAQRGLAIHPFASTGSFDTLSPADQALFARGSYLVNAIGNCNDCHTQGARDPVTQDVNTAAWLTGGTTFGVPPPLQPLIGQVRTQSQNLSGATNGFFGNETFFDFVGLLTQGVHVEDGSNSPVGFPMPVDFMKNMTLDDTLAIYTYLGNVTPIAGANDVPRQSVVFFCAADGDCVNGSSCDEPSGECVKNACLADSDCGACQTCDVAGADACLPADPTSLCVLTAF